MMVGPIQSDWLGRTQLEWIRQMKLDGPSRSSWIWFLQLSRTALVGRDPLKAVGLRWADGVGLSWDDLVTWTKSNSIYPTWSHSICPMYSNCLSTRTPVDPIQLYPRDSVQVMELDGFVSTWLDVVRQR